MGKRWTAGKYYCPKDSEHLDGIEFCKECKISAVLCRVKRSLAVLPVDGLDS